MARHGAARSVDVPDGTGRTVAIEVRPGDASLLRGVEGGQMAIEGNFKRDYERLQRLGLVKHRFETRGDWTVALAALTPLGRALLEEFPLV
jgi:hypothetical protein